MIFELKLRNVIYKGIVCLFLLAYAIIKLNLF